VGSSLDAPLAELLLAERLERPPAFALGSRGDESPKRQKRLASKLLVCACHSRGGLCGGYFGTRI
jgi:hypothetical protein